MSCSLTGFLLCAPAFNQCEAVDVDLDSKQTTPTSYCYSRTDSGPSFDNTAPHCWIWAKTGLISVCFSLFSCASIDGIVGVDSEYIKQLRAIRNTLLADLSHFVDPSQRQFMRLRGG